MSCTDDTRRSNVLEFFNDISGPSVGGFTGVVCVWMIVLVIWIFAASKSPKKVQKEEMDGGPAHYEDEGVQVGRLYWSA